MPTNNITIIKESNTLNIEDKKKQFPYFGNMYLEYFENIEKIKKDCIFHNRTQQPILKIEDYKNVRENEPIKQKTIFINDKPLNIIQEEEINKNDVNLTKDYEKEQFETIEENDKKEFNEIEEINENQESEEDNNSIDEIDDDFDEDEDNEVEDRLKDMLKKRKNDDIVESNIRHQNLKNITIEKNEDITELKKELLFKFKILQKSYPTASIPNFTVEDSYKTMKSTYDETIHMLTLDSNVESYKSYLIGGFMLTEFICGKFLNFDMQGFAQQQILQMNQYNKLLIELGEKTYMPKSNWPVELRIFLMIFMNAAMFIVSKMIMKNTGSDILNIINTMNLNNARPKQPQMDDPEIELSDFE